MYTRMLVALDGSKLAENVLPYARTFAAALALRVELLNVVESLDFARTSHAGHARTLDSIIEAVRRDSKQYLERVAQSFSGVPVTSIVEQGEADKTIIERAAGDKETLIAMATRGRSGIHRWLMGSVAEKVLRHLSCQVLMLRDSTAIAGESGSLRVLVPVDFSEHSQRALGVARELATDFGGRLHLLHVVELLHTPFAPGGLTSPLEAEPELRGKLQDALRGMLGETPGEVTVADGNIAGQILHEREKHADEIVVMGSRGLSGLKHLLIGSVAERVARFCEAPVWVVK